MMWLFVIWLTESHPELQMQPLQFTSMDNGVACESVHEAPGECTTGAAFATCAEFLTFALTEMAG
ncbi:MAG: hypothetical protein IKC28_04010 [Clostridia bacterium]|nr:hypothetical protein [Clostridia bacterium]MBR2924176.1 hypothetical protein [Clostridia bacterium]